MTIIGTSTSAFYERASLGINDLRKRGEALQTQLGSGQKLARSSDNPVVASRLRTLARAESLSAVDMSNANRASSDLELAGAALSSFADYLIRAKDIATQAATGTISDTQRAGLAVELKQMQSNLLALANSRDSSGHALFGGDSGGDAYVLDGSGNAVYQGTVSSGELSLGEGQTVTRSVTGPEFLNFKDKAGNPTNLMAAVKSLTEALTGAVADPAAAAREAIGTLDNGLDAITTTQTVVGSRLAWIDMTVAQRQDLGELRAKEQTDIGKADEASTMVELQQIMTVLEASQASFVKLANMSLFNMIQ